MATRFLGVPGNRAVISWDHIVEAHFFPPQTEEEEREAEAEGEPLRGGSLLVLTMAAAQVFSPDSSQYGPEPTTLRFRGPVADRMWEAIQTETWLC